MQIVAGGFLNTLIKRNNKKDLFMKYKLTPELSSDDWNEFCSRFHFSTTDLPHVQAIYLALFPLVNSYAYYSLEQDLDSVSAALLLRHRGRVHPLPRQLGSGRIAHDPVCMEGQVDGVSYITIFINNDPPH